MPLTGKDGLARGRILVADDEAILRDVLSALLSRHGYDVVMAARGEEALGLAQAQSFDAALVDVMMPGIGGLATLEGLQAVDADLGVVVMTAYASVDTAVRAIRSGAFDYVTKPFKNDELLHVLGNAVERKRLLVENRRLTRSLEARVHQFGGLVGASAPMRALYARLVAAAPGRDVVCLRGEAGSGKSLAARALHAHSSRSAQPFVRVATRLLDAASATVAMIGAAEEGTADRLGLLDRAGAGTLYIDEVAALPLEAQGRLVVLLDQRAFSRVGGVEVLPCAARLVVATMADLPARVAAGAFRADLLARLEACVIDVPPLRARREDIPWLVQHLLEGTHAANHATPRTMSARALERLALYDWPGNVRELESVVAGAVARTASDVIDEEALPSVIGPSSHSGAASAVVLPPSGLPMKKMMAEIERRLIESTLEAAGGVQKRAAELLQIKPTTLNEMIKRHGLRPRRSDGDRQS